MEKSITAIRIQEFAFCAVMRVTKLGSTVPFKGPTYPTLHGKRKIIDSKVEGKGGDMVIILCSVYIYICILINETVFYELYGFKTPNGNAP